MNRQCRRHMAASTSSTMPHPTMRNQQLLAGRTCLPTASGIFTGTWKRNSCHQRLARATSGWSNMVEEQHDRPNNGWSNNGWSNMAGHQRLARAANGWPTAAAVPPTLSKCYNRHCDSHHTKNASIASTLQLSTDNAVVTWLPAPPRRCRIRRCRIRRCQHLLTATTYRQLFALAMAFWKYTCQTWGLPDGTPWKLKNFARSSRASPAASSPTHLPTCP